MFIQDFISAEKLKKALLPHSVSHLRSVTVSVCIATPQGETAVRQPDRTRLCLPSSFPSSSVGR